MFVCLNVWICVCAQKKEISQAQTYIKSGTNLDKAEASMRKLLEDSANSKNLKIWYTLTEALKKQYEQGNEKLYLKQKYDTAALFTTGRKMFLECEAMDSVDAMPDKKGSVRLKYRKKNAEYLNVYRKNLFNGGLFFIAKKNYRDAFDMLDCFIDCMKQPLFSGIKYADEEELGFKAAYLAMYCGVKLEDNVRALKYHGMALGYVPGRENTLQFLANIWHEEKNDEKYCSTLRTGFEEFPKSEYFFTRLIDYYNNRNLSDSAMSVAESAIAKDSLNSLFLYAKANILLNIGKYKECVSVCNGIIARNDSIADVYYAAGLAYLNMAFEAEKKLTRQAKNVAKGYYRKALPFMEKYRSLMPEQKDKWASALYNIYLNLNMGKKFEEISEIIQG